ncbi:hypothetical protein [Piscirickettsia litoralis]|uniref:Uncharacterized protein n=1 Tax=Piscirickettsia litoralis TaxID=1891921 RepID=A0ABX3A315_9GAMM|nr:hypothetical protein [Piscirickettsia litoralis]ODN43271.1 hypothetical protein BGC07_10520 [Piscirickettsia litoralis]
MAVGSVGAGSGLLAQRLQEQLKQDREQSSELNKAFEADLNVGSVAGDRAARRDELQTRETVVRRVERTEEGSETRLERRNDDVGLQASNSRGREGRESEQLSKSNAERVVLDKQRESVTTSGVTAEGKIGSGVDKRRLEEQKVLQTEVQAQETPQETQQAVRVERRAVESQKQAQTSEARRGEAQERQAEAVSRREVVDEGNAARAEAVREQQNFINNIQAQRREAGSLQAQKLQARRSETGVQDNATEQRIESRQRAAETENLAIIRRRNAQTEARSAQEQSANNEIAGREQRAQTVNLDQRRDSNEVVEQRRQESPDAITRRANATTTGREQATQTLENLTNSNG